MLIKAKILNSPHPAKNPKTPKPKKSHRKQAQLIYDTLVLGILVRFFDL